MTSTSTEPVINRVSTLEQIAAEEGTGRGDPLPPLPPPPMQWQSAPSAESITEMISSFVQAEAATLRRDYFAHAKSRLVAARDKFDGVVDAIDDSVAHIIASADRGPPLLPTSSMPFGAPPVIRNGTSQGSIDAACASV